MRMRHASRRPTARPIPVITLTKIEGGSGGPLRAVAVVPM